MDGWGEDGAHGAVPALYSTACTIVCYRSQISICGRPGDEEHLVYSEADLDHMSLRTNLQTCAGVCH